MRTDKEVPQKYIWEGKILNKISKKIVSLVTMAAFALTLVPAAAFATEVSDVHATVTPTSSTDVLLTGDSVSIDFNVKIGDDFNATYPNGQIAFWYGKADDAMPGVDFSSTQLGYTDADLYESTADWKDTNWFPAGLTDGGNSSITATFDAAGVYDLYVGSWTRGETLATMDVQKFATVTVRTTDAYGEDSSLLIDGQSTGTATAGEAEPFNFAVYSGQSVSDMELANDGETVYVWAEDKEGKLIKDATFAAVDKDEDGALINGIKATATEGIYEVTGPVKNNTALTVTFPAAGEDCTVNAASSTVVPRINRANEVVGTGAALNGVLTPVTVDVAAAAVETADITVTDVTDMNEAGVVGNTTTDSYEVRISDEVTPSDTKVYTVTGYAWVDAAKKIPAKGEKISVKADKGMNITGLAEDGTVTTDQTGKFTFKFTLEDAGQYDVTLREVNNDASATLTVTQGDVDAASIAKVSDGGYVLAGNDYDYASQVYGNGTAYFSDAVQFAITDVYGREAVGPGVIADEWAAVTGHAKHDSVVRIIHKGDGSTLEAKDINLDWDENAGVYTLAYVGDNAAKDLVPGDYSVRIALRSGGNNAVTVNFTVAKFGTVQELVLDMYASDRNDLSAQNNAIRAIDDTVALGQEVNVQPKYVDENGLKVDVPNYAKLQVGINGDAVDGRTIARNAINFATALNKAANYDLVGSTITVKVNDPSLGAIGFAEKELTVVKNYLAETVSIDPTEGVVGEANTVNVSVVDADGNVSKVNGELTATIVGQSDEEATVDLKVVPQVKNGKATMYLESDKAGTVDVRVVVSAKNGELYADTFTYTFGDEDEYAGRYVVMTIGSSDYLINNEIVKGDAAPYVDDAWRTMVPFRVLGEAFGAEVDWNQDAQSVTYTVGDTEIVMTIGENTYTLNGEEQTMDTAPVLSGDRTYVPVRFVAEDLGFEVTPLYDVENGATASVVFQK